MKFLRLGLWCAGALLLSGCGIVYTNVRTPYAYRAATPSEVKTSPMDELATGRACDYSLLFLVAWGNSGYLAATEDALKGKPQEAILYDVKTDLAATSLILGTFTRLCTVVRGKVGHV
jgi:hypothetical protein